MTWTSREGGWAPPGWDEYTAARSRFFACLAADRVLREVAREVERDLAPHPSPGASAAGRAAYDDGLVTGSP